MVFFLALAFLLLSVLYAVLYVFVFAADRPAVSRRSAFYMILSMGLLLSAILFFCGWFFRDYLRYELMSDRMRISKGRFLRVIYYTEILSVEERFAGRKNRRQYEIVLINNSRIPVSVYIEDADEMARLLRERLAILH